MRRRLLASVVACLIAASCPACSDDDGGGGDSDQAACSDAPPTRVDLTTSPEKSRMIEDLAGRFNRSDAARESGTCVEIVVHTLSSGEAEDRLRDGWPDAGDGLPAPVIWTPASSTWATLLDQHLAAAEEAPMAYELTPVARTPLVIAMPRSLAEAVGWPDRPLGFNDIVRLSRADLGPGCSAEDAPAGLGVTVETWCAEDWGDFRLGKTNPFFSTSGLGALIAQAYAATGLHDRLTVDDLRDPGVDSFLRDVESSVVHYGATTLTFLENWFRSDVKDLPGPYVSAVAVEEKSVIDYNRGDPQGTLGPGEVGDTLPREKLVALYPEDGTFFSDNPLVVLDAPWADEAEQDAARRFVSFMRSGDVQERVLDYGFRPVEPGLRPEGELFAVDDYGVDPSVDVTELPVPNAEVLDFLREQWRDQRRAARVLLVMDVSGSMGEPADPDQGDRPSKLDLAKDAAVDAIDLFDGDDEVALWVFSTDLTGDGTLQGGDVQEVLPPSRVSDVVESLPNAIRDLHPLDNTALYDATELAYGAAAVGYDPDRINAVVLLTDGRNEVDNTPAEDQADLDHLIDVLTAEGQRTQPVRVFTIGYGEDADAEVLQQIAEATNAAYYDSSDPNSIEQTFSEVISNF